MPDIYLIVIVIAVIAVISGVMFFVLKKRPLFILCD